MSRFSSYLRFIFVILVIITLGEIGYYFFILNSPKNLNNLSNITGDRSIINISQDSASDKASLLAVSPQTREILNLRLSSVKKGFLTTSYIYSEVEGTIEKKVTEPWTTNDGKRYAASLYLKTLTGSFNYAIFSEEEYKIIKISLIQGNEPKDLKFKDLRKNDYVKIKEKVNLLSDDFFKGVESVTIEVRRTL